MQDRTAKHACMDVDCTAQQASHGLPGVAAFMVRELLLGRMPPRRLRVQGLGV